ncbi:MAG TPA: hypothetical protein VGK67_27480 [Myxococcales bacterium]|jgi:hypothetical protein
MAELIDLGLLGEATRLLEKLVDQRGIRFFMATEGPRLLALDPSKVDLVVRTAQRARERKGFPPHEGAVEHCHTQVRRNLIRRVAIAMLETGC